MADLTQTAANVGLTDDSANTTIVIPGIAGEALTQGQPVYKAAADQAYYKADADASIDAARATHICLTPAAAGEYFAAVQAGPMDIGATLTVGEDYVVSGTAGAIAPIADLATGDYVTKLGTASETDTLVVKIEATNILTP